MDDDLFGWDEVAEAYSKRFGSELDTKPFDRKILDRFAERAAPVGPICDLGCGPGQVAAYIDDLGYSASGIDLSSEMVHQATESHPDIDFQVGDMLNLSNVDSGTFGGVASYYSIVNLPPADHPQAFTEMRRILRPGGWLLISFHVGDETRHVEEFLGQRVRLAFHFFDPEDIQAQLQVVGFEVVEVIQRRPYSDSVEAPTDRAYIFAGRPEGRS